MRRRKGSVVLGERVDKRGRRRHLRRWSEEMEVRGQWKEAALWMRGGGGATFRRVCEGSDWWEKGE